MGKDKNWAHIDYPQLFLRQNTFDAEEKNPELVKQFKRGYFVIESATRLEITMSIRRQMTHQLDHDHLNETIEHGVRVFSDHFLTRLGKKQCERRNINIPIYRYDICHLLQVMHLIGVTTDDSE